ncbi:MAG: hypothetical protein ABW321_14350 [Polyangiales bacterium]
MRRAVCVLWMSGLLAGCVLPEYRVFDSTSGSMVEQPSSQLLPGASAECNSCSAESCEPERSACGERCDDLPWPISPAWEVPEEAVGYVKCLVAQCEQPCDVFWGCVGKYTWEPPGRSYTITIRITDAISGDPDTEATVRACQGADPACASGSGLESMGQTDFDGRVTLTVSNGFFGYFLIEPSERYYPTTFIWSQPTYRLDTSFTVNVFERQWLDVMAAQLDTTKTDTGAGHLIFRAENCLPMSFLGEADTNAEAEGMVVSYSPSADLSTRTFYTSFGLVVDPEETATTSEGAGFGGALNLPPRAVTVIGKHGDDDVSRTTVRMREGWLGLVMLVPDAR